MRSFSHDENANGTNKPYVIVQRNIDQSTAAAMTANNDHNVGALNAMNQTMAAATIANDDDVAPAAICQTMAAATTAYADDVAVVEVMPSDIRLQKPSILGVSLTGVSGEVIPTNRVQELPFS